MIRAVIFDMDGLLMDSEGVGLTVLHECAMRQGIEIPLERIRQTLGSSADSITAFYLQFYPTLDAPRLFRDFREAMHDLARRGKIPLKKGAKELLAVLREKNIPCAVASSSHPNSIRIYLENAGVLDAFAALISCGEGIASKPAPDIFLKAAQALYTAPENCLVLEDSVNGVKAGRAAGMTVYMVPDMIPYTDALAPYCDAVLPDLLAVIPRIAL
ncbi:MAG: HAD family phosphatase [Clostridiales bacterium]|nr:HAD family phosphatase [Clostridiales bacterium]